MKSISRRSFLKTGSTAALAVAVIPSWQKGWLTFDSVQKTGYFEKEFGITDNSRSVLEPVP